MLRPALESEQEAKPAALFEKVAFGLMQPVAATNHVTDATLQKISEQVPFNVFTYWARVSFCPRGLRRFGFLFAKPLVNS